MGYFRDLFMIESFETNNNYKQLSKNEMTKYWLQITNSGNSDDIEKYIYQKYKNMICYIFKNQGREYFIYTFYNKLVYEIHFLDMEFYHPGEDSNDLKKTDNSQPVFSVIMSIVINTIKSRSVKTIKISAPEHREELYLKIIKKVLSKYNIFSEVYIKNNSHQPGKNYYIELDWLKMTPENMMGESMLELDGPDKLDGRIDNILLNFK